MDISNNRYLSWLENYRPIYLIIPPVILGITCTAVLCSYISPWFVAVPDSATYLRFAEEIQKGHWHINQWIRGSYSGPPLYSLFVAIFEYAIHGFVNAGTIVSIVAASASVIPLFFLSKNCYDIKTAWITLPLTILNPLFLEFVSHPLTESLFTFFFITGVLLTYRAITLNTLRLWFFAGVIGGAALMTREVGIIIPAVSLSWLAIKIWKNRHLSYVLYKSVIALVLGIILVYAPLKIVMELDNKNITNASNGDVFFQLLMPDLRDETEREIYFGQLTPDGKEYAFVEAQKNPPDLMQVIRHLDFVVSKLINNITEMSISIYDNMGSFLLLFILLGILRGRGLIVMDLVKFPARFFLPASYVFVYISFYILAGGFTGAVGPDRYLVPLIPLWAIWASAGIFYMGKWIERHTIKHAEKVFALLCTGIILIGYVPKLNLLTHVNWNMLMPMKFESLGKGLKDISVRSGLDDLVVMDRSPFLSYYAGASWVMMPYGEYREILNFAVSRDVDFIFIDNGIAAKRPQLSFLLDERTTVPEMDRILGLRSRLKPGKFVMAVYKIKKLESGHPNGKPINSVVSPSTRVWASVPMLLQTHHS